MLWDGCLVLNANFKIFKIKSIQQLFNIFWLFLEFLNDTHLHYLVHARQALMAGDLRCTITVFAPLRCQPYDSKTWNGPRPPKYSERKNFIFILHFLIHGNQRPWLFYRMDVGSTDCIYLDIKAKNPTVGKTVLHTVENMNIQILLLFLVVHVFIWPYWF